MFDGISTKTYEQPCGSIKVAWIESGPAVVLCYDYKGELIHLQQFRGQASADRWARRIGRVK